MCGAVHVRGVEIGAERAENRVRGGGRNGERGLLPRDAMHQRYYP